MVVPARGPTLVLSCTLRYVPRTVLLATDRTYKCCAGPAYPLQCIRPRKTSLFLCLVLYVPMTLAMLPSSVSRRIPPKWLLDRPTGLSLNPSGTMGRQLNPYGRDPFLLATGPPRLSRRFMVEATTVWLPRQNVLDPLWANPLSLPLSISVKLAVMSGPLVTTNAPDTLVVWKKASNNKSDVVCMGKGVPYPESNLHLFIFYVR